MKFKKNKFITFYVFNLILLFIILLLAIPVSKYLSGISFEDNNFVINQKAINPEAKSSKIIDREVQINFLAKVDSNLNWNFKTLQKTINLKIGENHIVKYEGKNLSDRTITSTAIFTASPESIYPYLIKTECFCFIEQTLKPGESKIFSMVFFLDPSLDFDNNLDNLKELVFTYEFSEYKS
tara:strand:+ start:1573 stop:2115 length:543 start_codon:yes stop_codon:yes gene_type:complete